MKPITSLAISAFEKLKKAENRVKRLEVELSKLASKVPYEDINVYMEETEKIQKRWEGME